MRIWNVAGPKGLLLGLAFLWSTPAIRANIDASSGIAGTIGYLGWQAMLWAALIAASYVRPAPIRLATACLFAICSFLFDAYQRITGQALTYDSFITLTHSHGSEADALYQNAGAFLAATPFSIVLLVAMAMKPRSGEPWLPGPMTASAPWAATAALATMLFARGGEGGNALPPGFTPIAYLTLAGYEAASGHIGPRETVRIPRQAPPRAQNIVFIIDESIAGQYLDINSRHGVPTALSRRWPNIDIHNYGLGIAVTNCSVSSNVTLRYGGTRTSYRRIIDTKPSIWAYARKAGLRTVFIDGQGTRGVLFNYMTEEERREIDEFVQFDRVPIINRDQAVARELIDQLADPRPKFILVSKAGAHFPIRDKFPQAYLKHLPALPRGPESAMLGMGKGSAFGGTPGEWRLYRNSYRNMIGWTVSAFFEKVLGEADLSRTTMIYTSDHGQNLHEDGSSGFYTHCGPAPIPEEGVVPLMVIEGGKASGRDWKRNLAFNHDRSSHFMIFPTLLDLMGYHPAAIRAEYGSSLVERSSDPGSFNILFNARLNRDPRWLTVDRTQVREPLPSDVENLRLAKADGELTS